MRDTVTRFARFVWDRAVYALAFVLCALCLIAIVAMDQGGLATGNVVYLFVLSAFFILGALLFDYVRTASFSRQVHRIRQNPSRTLDSVMTLPDGISDEQRQFRGLLNLQHRMFLDQLEDYRVTEERRHLFTNQWVHQMKTPVSVIDLLLQQAEQSETSDDAHRLIVDIREENERLAHGLDMVLHQARLEKFEGDVQLKRIDMRELLRIVINDHKKSLIRASIFPQITGDPAWMESDEKWMLFVFTQIVSNAVKYSKLKDGNKRLSIAIEQAGGHCYVRITDEGIGIPSQDLDHVFHPYFTGENGRRTGESTGMGLYLAKEVCRRLGHGLTLTSEQGKGTTVTVSFTGSGIHVVPVGE